MILLSTIAFLNPQEQAELKFDPVIRTLDNQILVSMRRPMNGGAIWCSGRPIVISGFRRAWQIIRL